MSKKFIFLFVLVLVLTSGYLLRGPIAEKVVERTLSFLPHGPSSRVKIQEVLCSEGKIQLVGIERSDDESALYIDRIELSFSKKDGASLFSPKLRLLHPQLTLNRKADSNVQSVFSNLKPLRSRLRLEIHNGVLQLGEQRLYFAFLPGDVPAYIGKLIVSQDPGMLDAPFFVTDFHEKDKKLSCKITVRQVECSEFIKLASILLPIELKPQQVSGELQGKVQLTFNSSGAIEALGGEVSMDHVVFVDSALAIDFGVDTLQAHLAWPKKNADPKLPIWQQVLSQCSLKGGMLRWTEQWGLSHVNAEFFSGIEGEPTLKMDGKLLNGQKPFQFIADGKGGANQDRSFWIECLVRISENMQKQCSMHLSLCRPESETFVLQADLKNLFSDEWNLIRELFKDTYPIVDKVELEKGKVSATFLAWFERARFARLDMQNIQAEKAQIFLPEKKLRFDIDALKASGKFHRSSKYLDGELNIDAQFPVQTLAEQLLPSEFKLNDNAMINANCKWKSGRADANGSLTLLSSADLIQFGLESKKSWPLSLNEIEEGWIRCARLSETTYSPLLKVLSPSTLLQGNMDLFGTFEDGKLRLSVQMDQMSLLHPWFELRTDALGVKDPMLLKTEGRAQVHFSPAKESWVVQLPIQKGQILLRKAACSLENADGQFTLLFDKEKGTRLKGEINKGNLLPGFLPKMQELQTSFEWDTQEKILNFSDLKAAFTDQPELSLSVGQLTLKEPEASIEAKLLHKNSPIMLAKLRSMSENPDAWQGSLEWLDSSYGRGTVDAKLLLHNDALYLEGKAPELEMFSHTLQPFSLLAKIGKEQISIAPLQFNTQTWHLQFIKQKEGLWSLSDSTIENRDFVFKSQGMFEIEPSVGTFRAVLQGKIEQWQGKPIQAVVKPFNLAFSSDIGLVSSGVDITFAESRLFLDHFEYAKKSESFTGRNIQADLSSDFLEAVRKHRWLPPFFAQILKNAEAPLKSQFNFQIHKNALQVKGSLDAENLVFELSAEPLFGKKTCEAMLVLSNAGQTEQVKIYGELQSNHEMVWQKFEGSLHGMDFKLKRDKQISNGTEVFSGKIKGNVGSLTKFFSKDFYPLDEEGAEKGFCFDGHFIYKEGLAEFVGKCEARDFALMGYKLKKLDANIHLANDRLMVQSLSLKDDALVLEIEEGVCFQESAEGWMYEIPALNIKSFKPSLLTQLKGADKSFKPFFVKTAQFEQLRGLLGKAESVKGQGHLQFVTSMKAAASFDPSVDLLHSHNLEPKLLIPLNGEMECELRDGKCWILSLKGVQSEGKKIAFSLAESKSHLDLQGNLFLNLLIEDLSKKELLPFALKMRGNLERPQISLQNN